MCELGINGQYLFGTNNLFKMLKKACFMTTSHLPEDKCEKMLRIFKVKLKILSLQTSQNKQTDTQRPKSELF